MRWTVVAVGTNNMVPSFDQEPPSKIGASATNCGSPPAISTRRSLPFAEKASERLSGDQKDSILPSVPGSMRASIESSGRTQRKILPEASAALKATVRPSGDSAGAGITSLNGFFGGRISNQTVVSFDLSLPIQRPYIKAARATPTARAPASSHKYLGA